MPSMAFRGTVTKVGVMKKTATVTVARQTVHPQVGKVRPALHYHCNCVSKVCDLDST